MYKNHFELELNVQTEKEKSAAHFRIAVLKGYMKNGDIFPYLKPANQHLMAVLYYYTDQIEEAFETISEILDTDKDNINAHSNMAFLYERMLLSEKARHHHDIVQKLKNTDKWINVRSEFEFAYAHSFEMNKEVNELKRFFKANEIIDKCLKNTLDLATESHQKEERGNWMMCKIWNLKKVFNRNYTTDANVSKNIKLYENIMETLVEIIDSVPTDSVLNAMAFTYFGYFFWKKPVAPSHKPKENETKNEEMPEVLRRHEIGKYFNDPEECFKKALQIKDTVETLQQYGCWLLSTSRYEDAVEQFTKAITIDSSDSNYFSYSKRAESRLKKVEGGRPFQKIINEINLETIKDELDLVAKDFKFVVKVNRSSYAYRQLGLCYFYLSEKGTIPKIVSLSMSAFQEGLLCMDGKRDSRLHMIHAECLKEIDENKHAMFCLQRSIENQNPQSTFVGDIKLLLTWYEKLWKEKGKPLTVINEAQFWFQTACTKYKRPNFKEMVCQLMKVDTAKDFYIQLISISWLKGSVEMKEFCCEVVESTMAPNHPLLQVFQRDFVQDAKRLDLKSPNSMQTRNLKGFAYDFFVIYCDEDLDWVKYSLLNHLEHMRNFKGMVCERDSMVGKGVFDNLKEAISKSYKTIIVITPNYLKSYWCKHETEQVLIQCIENCHEGRIIPISKDNAEVPQSLRNLKSINIVENHFKETDLENLVKSLDS